MHPAPSTPAGRGRLPILPSLGSGPPRRAEARSGPIASSRAGPWRAAVLLSVHLLAALHILHWRLTGRTLSPLEPSEAMELGKHGVVNAGLVFFAAAIILTGLFGRFFCGWGCHLVALQDLCRWLLLKVGIRPRPLRSRLLGLVPLGAFAYMFLWPAAWRLGRGEEMGPLRTALTTTDFWGTFPGWAVALFTFAVCGFAAVYFLGAKGFCSYACPYGAAFSLADRLAPVRIRVDDSCSGCAHCTAVCSSNVRVHEEVRTWGMVVDPRCMKCLDCVSVCPNDALRVGWGRPAILAARRGAAALPAGAPGANALPWSEEAVLGLGFLLSFAAFRGLYGVFPFLLSLGWSAVVAYLCLIAYRLATRPHLALRRWPLKAGGRLLPAGRAFAAATAVLGLLWAHSGLVQWRTARGRALYDGLAGAEALDRDAAQRAIGHLSFADRWGLLRPAGVDAALADLYRRTGDQARFLLHAAPALEREIAARPAAAEPRYELALIHAARGQPEEGIPQLEEALRLRPGWREAEENLAGLLAAAGRYREAAARFAAAADRDPQDAHTRALLARALLGQGDLEGAEAEIARALAVAPELPQARWVAAEIGAARHRRTVAGTAPAGTEGAPAGGVTEPENHQGEP